MLQGPSSEESAAVASRQEQLAGRHATVALHSDMHLFYLLFLEVTLAAFQLAKRHFQDSRRLNAHVLHQCATCHSLSTLAACPAYGPETLRLPLTGFKLVPRSWCLARQLNASIWQHTSAGSEGGGNWLR